MFDQQLTFDGGAEDLAPATRQEKLFTAPRVMRGQLGMDADPLCPDCSGTRRIAQWGDPARSVTCPCRCG